MTDAPREPCPNPRCCGGHEVSMGRNYEPESEGRCALSCDNGWVDPDIVRPAERPDVDEAF